MRFFDSDTVPRINADCPWTPEPQCNTSTIYRTIDGSCNNLKNPNYGRAATPFQRLKDAEYTQGSLAFPRESKDGFLLPSARKLSTTVTKSTANEERKDGIHTVFVMQMGQFIDHDITHTPNHAKGDLFLKISHCLKITQNVAFEFLNFGISGFLKTRQNGPFLAFLINVCPLKM